MRRYFLLIAVVIMASALVLASYYAFNQPVRLTIAVGPQDSDDAKLVEAIAHRLQSRREPIQLKIQYKEGSAQAAEAIDGGKVDLAVTRADLARQPNAGVVLTLHKDPVMVLATRASGIKKFTDIKGKRIGVIRFNNLTNTELLSNNTELLKSILSYYSISEMAVGIVQLTIADLPKAVSEKRIDAVFVVSPSGEAAAIKAVEAMGLGQPAGPVFVPLSEPDALVFKNPRLVKDEIVRGTYGGEPAKPSVAISTIAVPHNIVASNGLSDARVASLTRSIFSLKSVLTRDIKLAARIEAPSTDKDSATPLHPGAAAYLDDEEQTFFDKYGDFFYIGSMLIGVLASGVAAMFSRRSSAARNDALEKIEEALVLLGETRKAETLPEIDAIEGRVDALVQSVVRYGVQAHLNATDIAAFNVTLQQVREALANRRTMLGGSPAEAQGPSPADIQELRARAAGALLPKAGPAGGPSIGLV